MGAALTQDDADALAANGFVAGWHRVNRLSTMHQSRCPSEVKSVATSYGIRFAHDPSAGAEVWFTRVTPDAIRAVPIKLFKLMEHEKVEALVIARELNRLTASKARGIPRPKVRV